MIAFSRAEIARLNLAARELMAQDGRLGRDALQVGEREFRVGDRIVCGRNARARLGGGERHSRPGHRARPSPAVPDDEK
jgi:ATP-dependent exoDNAse (exonuclease V) alpha subunit